MPVSRAAAYGSWSCVHLRHWTIDRRPAKQSSVRTAWAADGWRSTGRSGSRCLRRSRLPTEKRGPQRTYALPPQDLALSIDMEFGAIAVSARHGRLPQMLGTTMAGGTTDAQRPWSAHAVVQQLERRGISDLEIVEGRALLQIGTVKKDRLAIPTTDLAVTLSHQHAADAPRCRTAPQIHWPCAARQRLRFSWRCVIEPGAHLGIRRVRDGEASPRASRQFTSAARTDVGVNRRRRIRVKPVASDALR